MSEATASYLNRGIYSVAEASRYARVSSGRIRRWLKGYRFKSGKKEYATPPLWRGQYPPIGNKLALGFLDLIEVKFVDAFLKAGVSWDMIHKARDIAGKRFPGDSHPFCTQKFVTDGREIFVRLHEESRQPSLLEIGDSQQVFTAMLQPVQDGLEFGDAGTLVRWWPRGKENKVALDPKRSFGQPIVFAEGVPTAVLARSVKANGSVEEVARWYEISLEAVEKAVEFEREFAA